MKLSDFDFKLPQERIALRPAQPRSASRLLVAGHDWIEDRVFSQIGAYLRAGDRLILNDTKVLAARLFGQRRRISDMGESFARVEVTLLNPDEAGHWQAFCKPQRRVAVGEEILFEYGLRARVVSKSDEGLRLKFNLEGQDFDKALGRAGHMPLPPYIAGKRAADARDATDYQTVWAKHLGAVAAPTASLHFDDGVLEGLKAKGVEVSFVTLHVGAGTFLPVKSDDISAHKMHAEWGVVSEDAACEMRETHAQGGRLIPVGTTALRLIETAARKGRIEAFEGETDIFIKPGFEFHATDGLITNFHLPKSTLLMLVAALVGKGRMDEIYAHAIAQNYRFFSYGDASILLPKA